MSLKKILNLNFTRDLSKTVYLLVIY